MKKQRKHPRYKNPSDMDFHGTDRALTKRLLACENYEALPISESMRKAVYRGDNAHGDNCSFGVYHSGGISWRYFDKLLAKYVGKEFSVYYHAMTTLFPKGKDRNNFDWYLGFKFHKNIRYGRPMWDYEIVDGLIVKI